MIKTAIFCNNPATVDYVYAQGRRASLGALSDLYPTVISAENFAVHAGALADVEAVFSTWGMPELTPAHLTAMPRLRALFYAAGSVRTFAPALIERNITVVSAWGANAVPVAEFTLAQILLANKGYFANMRACAKPETRPHAFRGPGNFGETVGLLGAGQIGCRVIDLLRPFRLTVIVWDPFLSRERAGQLGVEKVDSLDDVFRRAFVVSNHVANLPETRGLLNARHFAAMRKGATFINTGRGATLVPGDLVRVLGERPDLTALLDVTDPDEPPAPDSPLYALPNVFLSAHIAGAMNDEVVRLADCVIEEFLAWEQGKPLRYAITREMLPRLA
jgi:phosphoglycerate dehydrogenase-like enzyme